jgi:hypothetical protein
LTITWTNPSVPSFSAVNIYQSAIAGVTGTKIGSNVLGTSFDNSGLLANTIYYYTVRGVNASLAETTNTDQYSGKTLISYMLSAAVAGTGSGTISSNLSTPGLVYSNGSYSASVQSGTSVTLIPSHDPTSIFKGWSGDVCNNQPSGNCQFTLTKAINVVANFETQHKFKIPGRAVYDDILQDIYSQALPGETIMGMSGDAPAFNVSVLSSMTANNNVNLSIVGGYDPDYAISSGFTTLQGRVNLKAGKVVFKNIKIK